jgi:hypothetical protein
MTEQKPNTNVPVTHPPILVDEKTAARLLSLSPRTIWQMRKDGILPYVQHGTRIGYRPEALVTYAAAREVREAEKKSENPC